MGNNQLAPELISKISSRYFSLNIESDLFTTKVQVEENDLIYLMEELKNDPDLHFDLLLDITATDFKDHYMVYYNLFSLKHGHKIMVKCRIEHESPSLITVSDLYPAAEVLECEVYDLMGIEFVSHPNLRRILLPEDFEGFPLRKDYKF
jgi:NADH:ubiquinone oxidoreductase subunit C